MERKAWPLIVAGLISLAAIVGVVTTASYVTVVAAGFIGFACAGVLTLVLALPPLLVAPDDVPHMSAGVFTIGYAIAMAISVLSGIAWDISGHAGFAFLPIAIAVLPLLFVTPLINFSRRAT